jgi:Flp pilus assembly protein TadG
MNRQRLSRCLLKLARPWRDDAGVQILEFALSLPLLVVFIVGIFDFSGAFTLKQKLTNLARDAARAAAADPATDLDNTTPVSVKDAFLVVDNYLKAHLSDCGLVQSGSPTGLTWTYTAATTTPPCSIKLVINRGYYFPANSTVAADCGASQDPAGQIAVIATCVNLQYSYPWRFGRVIGLLGGSSSLPTNISTTAIALNEN